MWISKKKYLEMKETIQDLKNDKKILQTVCEKYKNDLEKKPATIYIREPYEYKGNKWKYQEGE